MLFKIYFTYIVFGVISYNVLTNNRKLHLKINLLLHDQCTTNNLCNSYLLILYILN